jgi:ATP/maltotriose-dependent transcriptional regulator MalT
LRALAHCCVALGEFEEAESLAIECHRLSEASGEAGQIQAATELCVELYEAWGKPEQAAEWRATWPTSGPVAGDDNE